VEIVRGPLPWAGVFTTAFGILVTVAGASLLRRDLLVVLLGAVLMIIGTVASIWEMSQSVERLTLENHSLSSTVSNMDAMVRSAGQITLDRALNDILDEIYQIGGRLLRSESCAIFKARDELGTLYTRGVSMDVVAAVREEYARRGGLFSSARPDLVPIEDSLHDRRLSALRSSLEAEGLRSLLFVPLVYEKLILGFLFLFYETRKGFSLEELSLAETFGSQAAMAIRNGQLRRNFNRAVQEYRTIIDGSSDLVWTVNRDLSCASVNRRAEELTGRKGQEWLDAVLPRMGGRKTFARLRELDPTLQVILMSGHGVEDDVEAILSAGATAFLSKPFLLNELVSKINEALGRKDATEVAPPTAPPRNAGPAT